MPGTRNGGRWGVTVLAATLGATVTLLGAGCSATPGNAAGTPTGTPTAGATVSVSPTPAATPDPAPSAPSATPGRTASRPATVAPSRGPVQYDPARNPTDLAALTDGLVLGRPVNGVRHGELVVTIRNNGPFPVERLIFTVELPESVSADGGDWTGCDELRSRQDGYPAGSKCDKGRLGAGETRVYRLGVQTPAAEDGNDSQISRWLVDVWSSGPHDEMHRDSVPENNRRIFRVTRS
ncbi:hypothetical protein BDK92_4841 [Micromonospora pisi]|uniref:DUF11 domain-containing protein n=1 Tax=Micromonospora pisi TaxID=589240 RepID=A0A495JPM0_9ACTN|nr:hypothetical protein [Micromonospora pisi]RKR90468.1 hypothetical protein BDK92_4841 [Micromonospora pisi]